MTFDHITKLANLFCQEYSLPSKGTESLIVHDALHYVLKLPPTWYGEEKISAVEADFKGDFLGVYAIDVFEKTPGAMDYYDWFEDYYANQ